MGDRGTTFTGTIFRLLGGFGPARCIARAAELAETYAALDDAAVRAACRRFIEMPWVPDEEHLGSPRWTQRLAGRKLNEADAEAIAAGCEAFARFPPASISPGTRLYPEQVRAAVHLSRGALVQMDTGEGKTYAIMLAALSLLRIHSRVYVVTANPYLAMRDAANCAPFWAALGISVGLALPSNFVTSGWPRWEATVVYTTVESLIFGGMDDDLSLRPDLHRVHRGAVLVDEVDAVLLDQLNTHFNIIRRVAGSQKNWNLACQLALLLKDEHVERSRDSTSLRVHLTQAGQQEVVRLSGSMLDESQHLGLYRDVELAYTGLRVAVEGRDYETVDGALVPIDPITGWRTLTRIPDWIMPLASRRGIRRSDWTQRMHLADGLSALLGFDHFSGTSGTVINDALDYMLIVAMPIVVIPPRKPRYKGLRNDYFFISLDEVEKELRSVVAKEAGQRPILIVASSSTDAFRLAQALQETAPEGVTVSFAHGDTFGEQQLFEKAGEAGKVVVSTRQAGRGVDIQLNEQVRQNGGSLLILVGHAVQGRQDRQLLGRVGRSGDPFEARFWNHPDDGLLNYITDLSLQRRLNIEGPMRLPRFAARGIAGFQRFDRYRQLQEFAIRTANSQADAEAFGVLRRWRRLAQDNFQNWSLDTPFLREIASAFVTYHVPGISGPVVQGSQATAAGTKVMTVCGHPEAGPSLGLRLVGQNAATAREVLLTVLVDALRQASDANIEAYLQRRTDESAACAAVIGLQWLAALRRRVESLFAGLANGTEGLGDGTADPGDGPADLVDGAAGPGNGAAGPGNGAQLAIRSTDSPEEVSLAKHVVVRRSRLPQLIRAARAAQPPTPDQLDALSFADADGQLSALMVGALSLRRGTDAVTPEILEALARAIVRAEQALRPKAASLPALIRQKVIENRTPVEIVAESITEIADLMANAQDRLQFDLYQRQLKGVRYQNAYLAGMRDIGKICEGELAERVCRNLVTGADPMALGKLFSAAEHQVQTPPEQGVMLTLIESLPVPLVGDEVSTRRPRGRDDLISYFVEAFRASHGGSRRRLPSDEELVPALDAVLEDSHSLATLCNPEGVAEALDRWRRHYVRRRLLPWRRHRVDRAVREFLLFLHEQGLSARLPKNIQERTLPLRRRIAARVLTPRMQLAMILAGSLALAAVGLALVHVRPPGDFTGLARLADLCLAAGRLEAGLAVGPALLGLTGVSIVRWMIFGFSADGGVRPLDRLVVVVLAILGSLSLALTPSSSVLYVVLVTIALTVAVLVFVNIAWNLENIAQIAVAAGLAAVTILGVGLPALTRAEPHQLVLIMAAVGAVSVSLWRVAPVRLRLYSMRWAGVQSETVESVSGARTVSAHISWTVHAYAFAAGSLVGWATGAVAWLTPTVYLLVFLLWTRNLARSVTDPGLWTSRLRAADQAYAATQRRPSLAAGLQAMRYRFILREGGAGAVFVALAATLTPAVPLFHGPKIQLGLLAGLLGIIGTELAVVGLSSLRNIYGVERSGPDPEPGDVLSETFVADLRDVFSRFARRLSLAVVLYLALAKIVELLGVWDLLREWFELIQRHL